MTSRMTPALCTALMIAVIASLTSCKSAYYNTMEAFGQHKRDLLVDRVEDARDEQEEAKEQFASALDEFSALVNFDGGNLRATYDRLNKELERCQKKARGVEDRINSIETVSRDLFREWETELEQYSSADLRRQSEDQLRSTRTQYDQLISAMRRAESRMDPVLARFNDQVLYLKHNLNAQAIASLQGNVGMIQSDVAQLISEMETAIAEADEFIANMGTA